jgi:hypothetical protein
MPERPSLYHQNKLSSLPYLPVPFSVEDCGLLVALSVTFSFPSRVPVAVGLNTTLIVHFVFAARVVEHVVEDSLKSPVVEITMLLIAELRLFVSVNTFATLVVPTVCDANVALVGVNATGSAPVPLRATVCGLFEALSVIVRVPVRVPTWVGVNVTLIMQLSPAAKVLPQGFVLVARAKSPLAAMLVMFSVAVPVLASVTLFAGEVKFTTVLAKVSDVGVRVTTGPPPPPAQPLKAKDPIFVFQLKVPLTFSYWSTYQKVQSSLGSTCIAV